MNYYIILHIFVFILILGTSDSFVQFAKRNLRRQLHYKSDESALNVSAFGSKI